MKFVECGDLSKPVMLFIHGWPDSGDLWLQQLEEFKHGFHCVVVYLPNATKLDLKNGYDFPELIDQLASGLRSVLSASNKSSAIVVGHDWGAYLSYLLEQSHPELVDRLITMDVGGHFKSESLGHALFMVSYQWWLMLAFVVGKVSPYVGNRMSRFFCAIISAPRVSDVQSYMNYYYFYFWRGLLLKRFSRAVLRRYRPTKPVLYMYGKRKPYMFHSNQWIRILRKHSHSRIVEVEHGGHWFMLDQPQRTNSEIREWLSAVGM